jgi:hypothetical protein
MKHFRTKKREPKSIQALKIIGRIMFSGFGFIAFFAIMFELAKSGVNQEVSLENNILVYSMITALGLSLVSMRGI